MLLFGDIVVITCGPTLLESGSPTTSSQSSSTRTRFWAVATFAMANRPAANQGRERHKARGKVLFIVWLRDRSWDLSALPPGPKHRSRTELSRSVLNGRCPARVDK